MTLGRRGARRDPPHGLELRRASPPGGVATSPSPMDALFTRTAVAAADQALLSGLSFLVTVVLLRTVPAVEFGYYSVALPVALFLISVQNAIVNKPMAVLLAARGGDDRRRYPGSLWYGQCLAIVPTVCLVLAAIEALKRAGLDETKAGVAEALSVSALGFLVREFLRAHAFADEAPWRVVAMDLAYAALVVGLLTGACYFVEISAARVLGLMGLGSLTVALVFRRSQPWRFETSAIEASFRENWSLGRWALLGVVVTHVQSYSYLYLLGTLRGSVAVAQVSASRLLLMPLLLTQAGWANVAVPHGARLREENRLHTFVREQLVANAAVAAAAGLYVLALVSASGFVQDVLLTDRYERGVEYVGLWGGIFVAGFFSMNASCGLQVLREFRLISQVNVLTMVATVAGGYLLIERHGIRGGLWASLLGEVLLAGGLWLAYLRSALATPRGDVG